MPHTSKEWMESFAIFSKYETDDEGQGIHRSTIYEVYAGPEPSEVSAEDKARLEELDWHDYGDGSFHTFV
jgi:hypothetical protein